MGDELGREKPRQQLQRHARVDHAEQLLIQPDQHLHRVHPRIDVIAQLLVLLVEQHRQRPHQRILALEIVVKRALARLGFIDDVLYGRVLIPLLIKQLPRRRDNAPLRVAPVLLRHKRPPFVLFCALLYGKAARKSKTRRQIARHRL